MTVCDEFVMDTESGRLYMCDKAEVTILAILGVTFLHKNNISLEKEVMSAQRCGINCCNV